LSATTVLAVNVAPFTGELIVIVCGSAAGVGLGVGVGMRRAQALVPKVIIRRQTTGISLVLEPKR
jgi:hypothetical protein